MALLMAILDQHVSGDITRDEAFERINTVLDDFKAETRADAIGHVVERLAMIEKFLVENTPAQDLYFKNSRGVFIKLFEQDTTP